LPSSEEPSSYTPSRLHQTLSLTKLLTKLSRARALLTLLFTREAIAARYDLLVR